MANSKKPRPKVVAGSLAVAITSLLIYFVEQGFSTDLPTAVEGALLVVITFAVMYLTPDYNDYSK